MKEEFGRKTFYLYEGENILYELDEARTPKARYISLPGSYDFWLARVDYENNAVYYYVRDALGSVTALVDGRGKVVKRYFYSPYGKLRGFPGWGERMMGMMGKRGRRSTANPLTYTGREYDSSTGLYYYRARYYNPGVGRFISVDPLIRQFARSYAESSTLSGGAESCGSCGGLGRGSVPSASSFSSLQIKWLHPYTYVNNNPVNYIDPEGLFLTLGERYRIVENMGEAMLGEYRPAQAQQVDLRRAGRIAGSTLEWYGFTRGVTYYFTMNMLNTSITNALDVLLAKWITSWYERMMITNILPAVISGIARGELKAGREVITPSGPHIEDVGIGEVYWAIFWPSCGGNGKVLFFWRARELEEEAYERGGIEKPRFRRFGIIQDVRFYPRSIGNPQEVKRIGVIGWLYYEFWKRY